jgi:hypothetical protein
VDSVSRAFEDSEAVVLTMCDLSRAFDCVNHEILADKLRSYAVDGAALKTVCSYQANRQQVVSVEGASSRPLPVSYGVPQGSVVGSLLFIIMINDLDRKGDVILFADDTTLVSRGSEMRQALAAAELCLRVATDWFERNGLQLNPQKDSTDGVQPCSRCPSKSSCQATGLHP